MYKASLVLEGGGMRGLFTSGVIDYFIKKNVEFKNIYAVSAGCGNACNFMSKQLGRACEVNTKYRDDKRFASVRNLIATGNYFGKEFQLDVIPNDLYPYDYDAFAESPMNFYSVMTNCVTGEAEYMQVKNLPEDMEKIWASSSLPLLSQMVTVDGQKYLDGGVADSIPVIKSLKDGNKKNVIVLTRDITYRKTPSQMMGIMERVYKNYPKLVESMRKRHIIYNKTVEFILRHEEAGHLFVIRPEQKVSIKRLEKNEEKLLKLYEMGYETAKKCYDDMVEYLNTPYKASR